MAVTQGDNTQQPARTSALLTPGPGDRPSDLVIWWAVGISILRSAVLPTTNSTDSG